MIQLLLKDINMSTGTNTLVSTGTTGTRTEPEIEIDSKEGRRTFTIYSENGRRKEGLKLAFVKVLVLSAWDKTITTDDGSVFPVHQEQGLLDAMKASDQGFKCIVSFQVYSDGDAFAIARLWTAKVRGEQYV